MTAESAAGRLASEVRGYCAQCKSRCGTIATVSPDGRLVSVRPDRDHPNRGFCVKGAAAPQIVHHPDRLTHPLRRTNPKGASDPGWERIGWDEALTLTARRLSDIKAESGPEAVVLTRPAPGGSHAGDWVTYLQRLAAAFGTPNIMTTGHICSWGRGEGSAYTYGRSLPVAHYEATDTMLVWGHNPAVSHIQTWGRIRAAQRRGARLIVIDPRETATARRSDLWIRVRPGTDAALALGVVHVILRDQSFDRSFVTDWTNGPLLVDCATGRFVRAASPTSFVVWDAHHEVAVPADTTRPWSVPPALDFDGEVRLGDGTKVRAKTAFRLLGERVAGLDPSTVEEITSVPVAQIERLARELVAGRPVCYDTYNGVEQHTDTAQTARALGIMYALTGWLERPGGNVTFADDSDKGSSREPTRRPMGFQDRPLGAARRAVQAYNFYDAVLNRRPYHVRALVAFGGNALMQNGDSRLARTALQALDFQVHIDMFENPTAHTADLLLPAASAWESPGLATSFGGGPPTQGYVQYRTPVVAPVGEARPDIEIIFDLGTRLGLGQHFFHGDVSAAFDARLATIGLSVAALGARPEGVDVGFTATFRRYARIDADGVVEGFPTPTRKVELYSETFADHGYDPLPTAQDRRSAFVGTYPLILTSNKVVQYLHSSGRAIPALRRQVPEPYLELNPTDAASLSVTDGAPVRLVTPKGSIRLNARVTNRVPTGVVSTQTGWWEACDELGLPGHDPLSQNGANVNLILGNDDLDPISGSVPLKDYPCRVEPIPGRDA
jgi:anaerobic selenocysteine-containing dehydrogenase